MTATVHIERPEEYPYKVVLIRRDGDKEIVIGELLPGHRLEYQHVWPGTDLVIREVSE